MSYSDPRAYIYQDTVETDFGAGTGTAWSFKGPSGKQGSLKNIGVHVTELLLVMVLLARFWLVLLLTLMLMVSWKLPIQLRLPMPTTTKTIRMQSLLMHSRLIRKLKLLMFSALIPVLPQEKAMHMLKSNGTRS